MDFQRELKMKRELSDARHSKNRSGFTLIELLVVISIIALLLSILLPGLQKVKEQARKTVCLTRMKQWNYVVMAYGVENNSRFPDSAFGGGGHWWMQPLRPYYDDPKIRLCPSASRPPDNAGWTSDRKFNNCWATSNPFPELESGDNLYGSLSPNGWLMDLSPNSPSYGGLKGNSWDNLDQVKSNVPLFLGCWWVDAWPLDTDVPQPDPDDVSTWDIIAYQMQRFNVDRHNGRVSAVYMDGSCDTVGLKGLWRLKWHRQFDTSNATTLPGYVWPDWMK